MGTSRLCGVGTAGSADGDGSQGFISAIIVETVGLGEPGREVLCLCAVRTVCLQPEQPPPPPSHSSQLLIGLLLTALALGAAFAFGGGSASVPPVGKGKGKGHAHGAMGGELRAAAKGKGKGKRAVLGKRRNATAIDGP